MDDNKSLLIVGALVVILAVVAVGAFIFINNEDEDSEDDTATEQQNSTTNNIVETAQATTNLSTLVDAVVAAELDEALSDEDTMYTVFAPTNDAFADIQSTVDTLLQPENKSDLQDVLQYHVVNSKAMSGDLTDGQMIETLGGEMLKVRIVDSTVYINDSMVTTADVDTTNGVVHIIDKVLVPDSFQNVVEVAQATDVLSTLVTAVVAGELVDALSDENATYTVFAPNNDAFGAIQSTVDELLLPENKSNLQSVLQYHVVDSEVFSTELSDGQEITTLGGETLTIEIDNEGVFVVANGSRAQVISPDIITSNGIVHLIDTVLLP